MRIKGSTEPPQRVKRLTRPERAALTRQALLGAAERRFLADGYHAASLQDIADDAGYTKGAIFAAFESKAGLFLALCDEVFARRLEQIRALFEHFPTAESRVAALASQPIDPRNERWLLVAIEFCAQSARNPTVLGQFAERYRQMYDGLAELAGQDPGPLGGERVRSDLMATTMGLLHRSAAGPADGRA